MKFTSMATERVESSSMIVRRIPNTLSRTPSEYTFQEFQSEYTFDAGREFSMIVSNLNCRFQVANMLEVSIKMKAPSSDKVVHILCFLASLAQA